VFLIKKPSIALKKREVTVMENLKGEVGMWFNGRFLEFEEITEHTISKRRKERKSKREREKREEKRNGSQPLRIHGGFKIKHYLRS